jgi:hypothetical protein
MIDKNRQTLKYKWERQSLNQKEKISQYNQSCKKREETAINQEWQNLKHDIRSC